MDIDYESMKELMKILDAYDINYSYGNYYSSRDEKIIGHWLKIDADLDTYEIDEEDEKYNNDKGE